MSVIVNGEIVPEDAIRTELRRLIRFYSEHMSGAELKGQMELLLQAAKEQAIGAKLLLNEALRQDVPVSDEEVEERVQRMVSQCKGKEAFEKLLRRQNLTEAGLRASIRNGLRVDRFVAGITAGLPEPTEEEARKYYLRHQDEFSTRERAQVRHILLKPRSASEEDRAIVRARLLGLKRQVEEGADFGWLARTHSECQSGTDSGGMLGWVTRGTTLPAFDNSIFALDVGEVSDVVETPMGCHILQQVEHQDARNPEFEEVKDSIFDLIRHSRRGKAISDFVAGLKAKAVIEDDEADIELGDLAADEDA